ncbi:MAG: EamA family transporter [Oscillospiraceae bacterium]|nr:EamA family transporter [Oscillospiraceae bacterium]
MILIAASGWGIIGVFSRPMAAVGLNVVQVTFVRSLVVLAGMTVLLLIKDKALPRVRLKDMWIFLGTGLVSIVFFNVCYFLTIERTTLAAASILLYTAPCFVMLMSALFFKEKITLQKVAALVLAFVGCTLASGFAGGDIGLGALLTGIGAGLGYASYSIFGKVALKKYQTFTVIFYTFLVATICLFPFAGIPAIASVLAARPEGIAPALGLGLVSTFMPYVFYTYGLKYVEAGKASVLAFAEPMVAAVAGIVIFNEPLHTKNVLGILLIFAAIVLLNIPIGKGAGEHE